MHLMHHTHLIIYVPTPLHLTFNPALGRGRQTLLPSPHLVHARWFLLALQPLTFFFNDTNEHHMCICMQMHWTLHQPKQPPSFFVVFWFHHARWRHKTLLGGWVDVPYALCVLLLCQRLSSFSFSWCNPASSVINRIVLLSISTRSRTNSGSAQVQKGSPKRQKKIDAPPLIPISLP